MRDLHEIDQDITEQIPYLQRRVCTHRVMEESGVNALLDERNEVVRAIEAFEQVFGSVVEVEAVDGQG